MQTGLKITIIAMLMIGFIFSTAWAAGKSVEDDASRRAKIEENSLGLVAKFKVVGDQVKKNLSYLVMILFGFTGGLQIIMVGFMMMLGGKDWYIELTVKFFMLCCLFGVIVAWPELMGYLYDAVTGIGGVAAGDKSLEGIQAEIAHDVIANPMSILGYGAVNIGNLWNKGGIFTWVTSPIKTVWMFNLSMVIMVLYAFIALQVTLAMIEFYLMTSIALVFMPFGALKWTKLIFDKGLHLVINSALKLMMITFLVFLIAPLLDIALPEDPSYPDMFGLMTMLAAVIWLMWKLPHMVTQVANSQPVSANDIASSIGRGVRKGINKVIEYKTGGASKTVDAGVKVEKAIDNVRSVAPPPIPSGSSQDKSPLEKS